MEGARRARGESEIEPARPHPSGRRGDHRRSSRSANSKVPWRESTPASGRFVPRRGQQPPAVRVVASTARAAMVTANAHKPSYEPSKSTGLLLLVISLALVALPIASIVQDLQQPSTFTSDQSHSLGVLLPLTIVPALVLLIVRWLGLGLYLRN